MKIDEAIEVWKFNAKQSVVFFAKSNSKKMLNLLQSIRSELRAKGENEWILCSDRLPNNSQPVLVVYGGKQMVAFYVDKNIIRSGGTKEKLDYEEYYTSRLPFGWWVDNDDDGEYRKLKDESVKHWSHLPKSPVVDEIKIEKAIRIIDHVKDYVPGCLVRELDKMATLLSTVKALVVVGNEMVQIRCYECSDTCVGQQCVAYRMNDAIAKYKRG